jgi:hypothetical protein
MVQSLEGILQGIILLPLQSLLDDGLFVMADGLMIMQPRISVSS